VIANELRLLPTRPSVATTRGDPATPERTGAVNGGATVPLVASAVASVEPAPVGSAAVAAIATASAPPTGATELPSAPATPTATVPPAAVPAATEPAFAVTSPPARPAGSASSGPPRGAPIVDSRAFNPSAAEARLHVIDSILASCRKADGRGGPGMVHVVFANDGSVRSAHVAPPFTGTPEGDCAEARFGTARIAPFEGAPGVIDHRFLIPK